MADELTASGTLRKLRDRLPIDIGSAADAGLQALFDSLETKIAALEDNIDEGGTPSADSDIWQRVHECERELGELRSWRLNKCLPSMRTQSELVKTLAARVSELWQWYDHNLHRVADTELDNQRHRKDGVLSDLARCQQEMRETRPGELPSTRKLERWAGTLEAVAGRLGDML